MNKFEAIESNLQALIQEKDISGGDYFDFITPILKKDYGEYNAELVLITTVFVSKHEGFAQISQKLKVIDSRSDDYTDCDIVSAHYGSRLQFEKQSYLDMAIKDYIAQDTFNSIKEINDPRGALTMSKLNDSLKPNAAIPFHFYVGDYIRLIQTLEIERISKAMGSFPRLDFTESDATLLFSGKVEF